MSTAATVNQASCIPNYQPPQSTDALADEIALLSAHIDAATYRLLRCIRAFDEARAYEEQGARSTAHWLNWRIGLSLGAAREKVRVARALVRFPKISAALAQGEVSYSKVRELTRIATPDSEDYLLDIAKTGTASHVEKLVRRYRGATQAEQLAHAKGQHQGRYLRTYTNDEGMLVVDGRLPPECGALLHKALDAIQAELRNRDDSYEQQRADALVEMSSLAMAADAEAAPSADRHQVVLHLPAETLSEADCDGGELEDGQDVPAETCRRLACDASVVRLTEGPDGTPLDVGRKTRVISTPLRRALKARDEHCRFPGCDNRFVDAHHIVHWGDGGETKLSNLLLICRRHHRLLHEGGFRLQGDATSPRFYAPNQTQPLPSCGKPPKLDREPTAALMSQNQALGLWLTPETGFPTWDGDAMDYEQALMELLPIEALQRRYQH